MNTVMVNDDADFGFRITCKKCGSDRVEFDNSLGWSVESGTWGSVELTCLACKAETPLVGG